MKAFVLFAIVALASSQMLFGGWTEVKNFDRMNDAHIDRAIKKLTDYAKKDLLFYLKDQESETMFTKLPMHFIQKI